MDLIVTGASAPATRAAVAAGATILDLQREIAARRGSRPRAQRRVRRGRDTFCYDIPPYFPSDVC